MNALRRRPQAAASLVHNVVSATIVGLDDLERRAADRPIGPVHLYVAGLVGNVLNV